MSYDLSKIPASYLSHPHKPYVDHVGRMMESFDDGHFKKTALYHDLLKLASKFQAYISYDPATGARRPPKTTHALESAFVYYLHHKEPSVEFLATFFAIAHHHGALPDIGDGVGRIMLKKARQIRSSAESIREVLFLIGEDEWDGKTTRMQFFLEQMKDRLEEFYGYENALMFRRLFSRLVLADKYEAVFDAPRVDLEPFGQAEIDAHLQSIQSYIEKRSASVEPQMADYRRRVREAVMESYRRRPHSRHYIIKAPTGAGKTLLALELALRIAAQKGARRIITALPFTSIIDQTTRVYEEILGAERVLKYHHLTSYKNDDEKSQQLSTKIFAADVWQSPFVVTTFNQLFYTIFSNHNRDMLRLETLRGSVVILDEIQAISRVLWRDLYKSLDLYAKEYDITFIFMSATMPDLSPYLGEVVELSREWFFTERKPRYRLHYEPQIDTIEALAKKVQERRGDSTLCVLNTIAKAKTLYRQLPGAEGEERFLLTTHQIPKHRKEIIAQIARRLSAGEPLTLVATQLIEAGVDLDFAGGFREFAPFASIIQSAGRINREGRREEAELVVTDESFVFGWWWSRSISSLYYYRFAKNAGRKHTHTLSTGDGASRRYKKLF